MALELAALRALDHALSDPMATRKSVRRQMVAALCQIADWGPEGLTKSRRR